MSGAIARSEQLKELMSAANISSYRALSRQSGVSLWQIELLRAGKGDQMRLKILASLAITLKVSLSSFLKTFELLPEVQEVEEKEIQTGTQPITSERTAARQLAAIKQEYERLQAQLEKSEEIGRSQVKADALQTLESWLVQWPTIAKRARENEALQAIKVLPFVHPVEQLMNDWGVEAIAPVDAEVDYDPQRHQLVGGTAEAGKTVRVTHSGSLYQDKILHRAKVKLI